MNKLEYNNTGGFPLTTNRLDDIQETFSLPINGLAAMAGNITIISGCIENGNTVTDGWIFLNGEIFEFRAGIKQDNITLFENNIEKEFENGVEKLIKVERYFTFGTGATSYKWSDFKRISTLSALEARISALEKRMEVQEVINAPDIAQGTIKIWGKEWTEGLIPGWVSADEWLGYILRGGGNVGEIVGSDTVTISNNNLPPQTGSITVIQPYEGDVQIPGSLGGGGGKWYSKKLQVNTGGTNAALSVLPKSKIVMFIRYVGI